MTAERKSLTVGFVDAGLWVKPYILTLLSDKYDVVCVESPKKDPDLLVFSDWGGSHKNYKCKRLFVHGEAWAWYPKCHLRFTGRTDTAGVYVPYYITSFHERSKARIEDLLLPKQTKGHKSKFCAFMYSHDVDNRNDFFDRLSKYKRVDALGKSRRNTDSPLDRFSYGEGFNSIAAFDVAVERYKDYKFVICFENCSFEGQITEKIINPMLAWDADRPPSIPIYFGAPDIAKHFNPKSFVNVHDFKTFDAAIERVKEIDQNDELYRAMLAEPWLVDTNPCIKDDKPKKALEQLIESPQLTSFSYQAIPGVDVIYCNSAMTSDQAQKVCEIHNIDPNMFHYGNSSVSYIDSLKSFLESKHNTALILNDKFELVETFRERLECVMHNWDMKSQGLMLLSPYVCSWNEVIEIGKVPPSTTICKLFNITTDIYGHTGYIVTRDFATEYMKTYKPGSSEHDMIQQPGNVFIWSPIIIPERNIGSSDGNRYWDEYRKKDRFTQQLAHKKLHIGCGKKYLKGYKHVDVAVFEHVDFATNILNLHNIIEEQSVEEIYACHILEHLERKEWQGVLKNWFKMLIPGGTIRLSVPDFEACCKLYLSGGAGLPQLMGLLYGGQRDQYDFHKIGFDFKILSTALSEIGFVDVKRYDTFQFLPDDFDDYSKAFIPHMDRNGTLMSLNVQATKPLVE